MKRKAVLAVLAMVLMGIVSPTGLPAVLIVTPANPTTADTVVAIVGNNFPRTCWWLSPAICGATVPDTFTVLVNVQYCGGEPSCNCNDLPVSRRDWCVLGRLAAGTYVVTYREEHINPYDPIASYLQIRSFTVRDTGSVPVVRRSWGRLKSVYR